MASKTPQTEYHVVFVFTRTHTKTVLTEPKRFMASGQDQYDSSTALYMMERLRSLGDGWTANSFPLEPWEYRAYQNG